MNLIKDLNPAGTYVAVVPCLSTRELLAAWMLESGVPCVMPKSLHVTVLYSRNVVPVVPDVRAEYYGLPGKFDIYNNCLVLKIDCPALVALHDQYIRMGGTHDHKDYSPHVTLAMGLHEGFTVQGLKPIEFGLIFGNEYTEPLQP